MTDREGRIRDIAYLLWLEEGCPIDAAERHWLAAEGLVENEPLEGETPDEPKTRVPTITETAGSD
jgi:Protein of unknown function (DUF2934)